MFQPIWQTKPFWFWCAPTAAVHIGNELVRTARLGILLFRSTFSISVYFFQLLFVPTYRPKLQKSRIILFLAKISSAQRGYFQKRQRRNPPYFSRTLQIRHKFSFACFGGTSCENLSNSSLCCKNLVYPSKYKMARERSPTEDVMVVIVVRWFTHDVYNLLRSRRS